MRAAPVDRIGGLLVAGFGLALLAWIVPGQTETVDHGWVKPQTLPNVLAVLLVGLGLARAVAPPGPAELAAVPALRAAGFLVLAVAAAWAMGRFGFALVAPALMAVAMLALRERRPLWLGLGVAGLPALVWLVAVVLLGRPLPG